MLKKKLKRIWQWNQNIFHFPTECKCYPTPYLLCIRYYILMSGDIYSTYMVYVLYVYILCTM